MIVVIVVQVMYQIPWGTGTGKQVAVEILFCYVGVHVAWLQSFTRVIPFQNSPDCDEVHRGRIAIFTPRDLYSAVNQSVLRTPSRDRYSSLSVLVRRAVLCVVVDCVCTPFCVVVVVV